MSGVDTSDLGGFSTGVYVAILVIYVVTVWGPSLYFLYQALTREDDDPFVKPCQCWFEWSWKKQYVCAEVLFRIHFIFSLCSIVVVSAEESYRKVWVFAFLTVLIMVILTSTLWYISMLSNGRVPTDEDKRLLIVRSVRSLTIDEDTAFGDVLRTRKTQMFSNAPLPVGGHTTAAHPAVIPEEPADTDGAKSRSNSHSEGAVRNGESHVLGMRVADMHTLSASVELESLPKKKEDEKKPLQQVTEEQETDDSPAAEEPTLKVDAEAEPIEKATETDEMQPTPMTQEDREELDKAWNDAETELEDEEISKEKSPKEETPQSDAPEKRQNIERVVSDSAVLSPSE